MEFRHLNELLYALSLESMKHYSAKPSAQVHELTEQYIACPLLILQVPHMHWVQAHQHSTRAKGVITRLRMHVARDYVIYSM